MSWNKQRFLNIQFALFYFNSCWDRHTINHTSFTTKRHLSLIFLPSEKRHPCLHSFIYFFVHFSVGRAKKKRDNFLKKRQWHITEVRVMSTGVYLFIYLSIAFEMATTLFRTQRKIPLEADSVIKEAARVMLLLGTQSEKSNNKY